MDHRASVELRNHFVANNAWRYSPKLVQTGGTTGKQTRTYLDGRSRALWNMMMLLRMQWAGSRQGDRLVVFMGPIGYPQGPIDLETTYKLDRSGRTLFLNGTRLDNCCLQEFARLLRSFRPHLLLGFPSRLVLLARTLNSLHSRFRLRAVLTSGELLGDEERRYLEDTFACKVFDQYDLWEIVAFAPQCERGSYHIIPEISYVEILRNGCSCEPDQVGEIVGTHLANYSMPLIRYNISDLASPIGSPCPCGRNTQTMVPIGGKGRDLIVTPRGVCGVASRISSCEAGPPSAGGEAAVFSRAQR